MMTCAGRTKVLLAATPAAKVDKGKLVVFVPTMVRSTHLIHTLYAHTRTHTRTRTRTFVYVYVYKYVLNSDVKYAIRPAE